MTQAEQATTSRPGGCALNSNAPADLVRSDDLRTLTVGQIATLEPIVRLEAGRIALRDILLLRLRHTALESRSPTFDARSIAHALQRPDHYGSHADFLKLITKLSRDSRPPAAKTISRVLRTHSVGP